jgi:hypothetical protein
MVFELLKLNIEVSDDEFNSIYPEKIRTLARKHWTPVSVAKLAAEFLVEKTGTRVLDIGSGAGKFCMIGATHTKGYFTGVEQRLPLVNLSTKLSAYYYIRNVSFIHSNITSVAFSDYNAFYFYNSFHENIDLNCKIDDTIKLSAERYHSYSTYIAGQFASLPPGSRLATYYSPPNIVPRAFKLQDSLLGGALNFWEKISGL